MIAVARRYPRHPRPQDIETDSLDKLLRDRPTDERQGSTATLGFTFQQWWAALRAVELLGGVDDFAIGMEVKEDVALLDSATAPSQVEFCQVKKNESANAWSLKELHRSGKKRNDKSKEPSIIAKLYRRRHEFAGHKTLLRFVSNCSFKVPVGSGKSGNCTSTRLTDLPADDQVAVRKAIADQLTIAEEKVDLHSFALHTTNLPLGEPEKFVAGKLMELCENGTIQFQIAKPIAVVRMIASELQGRSANTNYATSFDSLRDRVMSRGEVFDVIAQVCNLRPTIENAIDTAIQRLDAEQYSFKQLREVRSQKVRVCVDAVDRTNESFRLVARVLIAERGDVERELGDSARLGDLLDAIVEKGLLQIQEAACAPDIGYIKAVALLVLNDGIEEHLLTSSVDTQSEERQ